MIGRNGSIFLEAIIQAYSGSILTDDLSTHSASAHLRPHAFLWCAPYPNVSDQVLYVGVAGLIADYPIGYREGDAPAPLVVSTHGGPASSNVFRWVTESEYIPQLTQLGYFVLQPNYRGSTGYGCEFSDDVIGA
jgi:hypothetical protein